MQDQIREYNAGTEESVFKQQEKRVLESNPEIALCRIQNLKGDSNNRIVRVIKSLNAFRCMSYKRTLDCWKAHDNRLNKK